MSDISRRKNVRDVVVKQASRKSRLRLLTDESRRAEAVEGRATVRGV
jgi:hypothetical protein